MAASSVRGAHFTNKSGSVCAEASVLTDQQGKVVAYYLPRDGGDHLAIDEVGVAEGGACAGVLGACAALANDKGVPKLRFHVPPPHPFSRYLLQFRSVHETQVLGEGSGMLAFVDEGETLEHLIPEWEGFFAANAAREIRAEVTLVVDGHPYRIRVQPRRGGRFRRTGTKQGLDEPRGSRTHTHGLSLRRRHGWNVPHTRCAGGAPLAEMSLSQTYTLRVALRSLLSATPPPVRGFTSSRIIFARAS